jgi:hypothetical protein
MFGLRIERNPDCDETKLSQAAYVKRVLERFFVCRQLSSHVPRKCRQSVALAKAGSFDPDCSPCRETTVYCYHQSISLTPAAFPANDLQLGLRESSEPHLGPTRHSTL